MKRNPIILIILAVALVIVANAAVIISQHKRIQELSDIPELTMKLRQENILLKEGFFHTYDYEDATVDRNLSCRYFYAPSPLLPELTEIYYESIDGRVDLKK